MSRQLGLSTRIEHAGTLYFVALLREELGRRIKVARTATGLSQQELAWKIGLKHAQDVSRYERGKVEVPSHRIDLIAEATDRPRSFFVRDPGEPETSESELPAAVLERLDRLDAAVESLRQDIRAVLGALPEAQLSDR